ncbi:aminoglycoside phosphotransferase family protein [Streptomyces sp. TRM66268-LWL]|uniref:Aminoglycoside phosphotransferase family protein n=1 Tax=Streptomyces polyasparticus TaxID=2767826 RepID=A0ABR7SQM8_9ACTN|nr:aminoglycoside phosphotransferase family protein [Streptomyces polyasparticus]MBC9716633.1 aminoglycoside phosphotransferase family protein [Streptomyces polyasparticus]
MTRGHHNRNFRVPLTEDMAALLGQPVGTDVMVRTRLSDALRVVIRTWPNEAEVLDAVRNVLPQVPRCLATHENTAIHSYVEGVPLSSICENGKPVDSLLVRALTGVLAEMTQVRKETLPRLPDGWPRSNRDSRGFLRALARLADEQIRKPNWAQFGGLFAALGVSDDALTQFALRLPAMSPRPFSLLHTDLHRDNIIVTYSGRTPLIYVDWELSSWGDPLHDLANHLVRMHYPEHQQAEVIEAWATDMQRVRPEATFGLSRDLKHYLAFEYAQSVFPDVMRAATSLGASLAPADLHRATRQVARALTLAAEPLGLAELADQDIQRILIRWQTARLGRSGSTLSPGISFSFDDRLEERPECNRAAVLAALEAEGAAPADRVFKGTAHLNTVVRVPGHVSPVVVRRKIAAAGRRERIFLSEHAVLRAIEESEASKVVRAPRVLALGTSHGADAFAIHSYEGPADENFAPNHPEHGLLPHEADNLVDQLCALTQVDYEQLGGLDPTALDVDFYEWLTVQLVQLVDSLPAESKKLARALGLPDRARLQDLLRRHRVTARRFALLHGDLNPWNLVRANGELTIIDWEMAMVGDPLYDLVRHLHLTPVRPAIRDRMFTRWSRYLGKEYTSGWKADWRVYRWIELIRSAYIDLDRLVTGDGLDAPNVRRAVDRYAMTLADATAALGLPSRPVANPYLVASLPMVEGSLTRADGLEPKGS